MVLSLEPIPFSELPAAFASASLGAAVYTSDFYWNQALVGGASGKMMSYMYSGLPVLITGGPGITEVIEEFKCGAVLSALEPSEFNSLVRRILAHRTLYAENAVSCYNELYEFDQAFLEIYVQFGIE